MSELTVCRHKINNYFNISFISSFAAHIYFFACNPQKYRKMRRRQDEHGMSDAPFIMPDIVSLIPKKTKKKLDIINWTAVM